VGQEVEAVAWEYLQSTIRNVDSLKRYQGLKAALRMLTNQVRAATTAITSYLADLRSQCLMTAVSLQASRFQTQLLAHARVVIDSLTALQATHVNKDVRMIADEAISASLAEVRFPHAQCLFCFLC
jgi:malate/lactate dehydrogenase